MGDAALVPVGHALNVHDLLMIGAVVVHDEEQRDLVVRRRPQDPGAYIRSPSFWICTHSRPYLRCASAAPTAAGAAKPTPAALPPRKRR